MRHTAPVPKLRISDPGHVFLRRAARAALCVPLLYWFVGTCLDYPQAVLPVCFSTYSIIAFADLGGPRRDKLIANLTLAATGLVLVIIGGLLAPYLWPSVVATLAVVFCIAYAGVLRGYFGAAGMAAIVPWVLSITGGPTTDVAALAFGWALGGITASLAVTFLWPLRARSILRQALANGVDASAACLRAIWVQGSEQTAAVEKLKASAVALRGAHDGRLIRPGGGTARDRALMLAIEEQRRLKTFIVWDQHDSESARDADIELAAVTADQLAACAKALRTNSGAPDPAILNAAREKHQAATAQWIGAELTPDTAEQARRSLAASFHIRATSMTAQILAFDVRGAIAAGKVREEDADAGEAGAAAALTLNGNPVVDLSGRGTPWSKIASQWTWRSPWLRTAVRTSIAITATVLAVSLTGVSHGFWVSLGALAALKFNASGTGRTALQVLVGTVAGFAIGAGVLTAAGQDAAVYWLLLPVVVFLAAFTPGAISMIVGQAAFTLFLIVLFGISAPGQYLTGAVRVEDIALGLAVSLAVSVLIWPRGVTPMVYAQLREAVAQSCGFLIAAYVRIIEGPPTQRELERAEHAASVSVARANETFDLAYSQSGPGMDNIAFWMGSMNSARHIVYGSQFVASLARVAPLPASCARTAGAVLLAAEHARATMLSAVDRVGDPAAFARDPANADLVAGESAVNAASVQTSPVLQRLRDAATADLAMLAGSGESADQLGRDAIAIGFAVGWAVQSTWLADNLESLAAP